MKPERWEQIDQLLDAALEREPEERAAFLAAACAGDEALRQEVESLLAAHEQAGSFIDAPPAQAVAEVLAAGQAPSMLGRTLGRYQLCSLLGAGGMGEVYRAKDTRLGREVAVKILPQHLAANREALARFEREAKAVAALSHPNILAIHDFGTEGGIAYAVMELLEGETLRGCLSRSALAWRRAVEIGAAVAEGLSAAHAKGIIHRDLKPENIFLTAEGGVKILDFGLARIKPSVSAQAQTLTMSGESVTQPGRVMGTFGYMSPEQVRGETAEAPSDLFALGCVLYEMLSGQRAFSRQSGPEIMAAILRDDPAALTPIGRDTPGQLEQIVRHCLEKKPGERFQSARDLAFDLRALLSASRPAQSLPTPAGARLRPAAWAVAAAAALALGAVVWLWLSNGRGGVIDSLAVLPLVNVSGDADAEYLSDGITESIINSLSQLPRLRVMARSTVFTYKGKQVDPRRAGQEMSVRAVLTGRMTQRGDTVTIGAELVNAADGSQLWGEQYSRKLSDVLALQAEIAQQISEKLRRRLSGEEQRPLAKHYTENTEAYQLYIKGRYYSNKQTVEGWKKGIEYLNQAVATDPAYALACAGLAASYYDASGVYYPPQEVMPKTKAAALRALQLDEALADAHTSLALVKGQYEWNRAEAEQEYQRALELNPNYAPAHQYYGLHLLLQGRLKEATAELILARELDPLTLTISAYLG